MCKQDRNECIGSRESFALRRSKVYPVYMPVLGATNKEVLDDVQVLDGAFLCPDSPSYPGPFISTQGLESTSVSWTRHS